MKREVVEGIINDLLAVSLTGPDGFPLFAVGYGLPANPGDYRLAIRLQSEEDRKVLTELRYKSIIDRAQGQVDTQVTGIVRVQPTVEAGPLSSDVLFMG